jgi:hypothetical protein
VQLTASEQSHPVPDADVAVNPVGSVSLMVTTVPLVMGPYVLTLLTTIL